MGFFKNINWRLVFSVITGTFSVTVILFAVVFAFVLGFKQGELVATGEYESVLSRIINEKVSSVEQTPLPVGYIVPVQTPKPAVKPRITWGGPELWEAVNQKRIEYGVNPLAQRDELCTVASIRLNEILELGKLDNHEGFSNMPERRPDLKWIFEKYVIAEFLVGGVDTPREAVELWYNTLGHKKLLTGGEYAYGCIYAQNGFGVAIAAYE